MREGVSGFSLDKKAFWEDVGFGGALGAVEGFGGAARYDLEELRFIVWEELLLGRLGWFSICFFVFLMV
jgi:hypothetical protein